MVRVARWVVVGRARLAVAVVFRLGLWIGSFDVRFFAGHREEAVSDVKPAQEKFVVIEESIGSLWPIRSMRCLCARVGVISRAQCRRGIGRCLTVVSRTR